MHLLILGATGKSGGYGYRYALSQGHNGTVIVRNATGLGSHPKLMVVEGSVLSQVDMDKAFSAAVPGTKFLGPPRLLADATANAARALRRQQQREHGRKPRLVVMSALGAGESRKVTPFITRFIIDHSNVGKTYEDHNAVDAEIEGNCEGEVAWTVALAVGLGDAGVKPVKTFEHTQPGGSWLITRESCARWMVDVAAGTMEDEFGNKRVIVSN